MAHCWSCAVARQPFDLRQELLGRVGGAECQLVALLEPLVFLHRQEHRTRAAVLGHHHRAREGNVAVVGELANQFACCGHDGIACRQSYGGNWVTTA
ncbi:protein of unknown function (plasmid) [Rhodovastum atsumiense]|nr:protein of unknown function [Rhodovastum atsumiense]